MPCNSDYMEATGFEVEVSRVACLLDEIEHGKQCTSSEWDGYHNRVYGRGIGKADADDMVRRLCELLQNADVTKHSLEMQLWWRDHQKADKERVERELRDSKTEEDRQVALQKLSDYERKLLGIE